MVPQIVQITIFPMKSCDGVALNASSVLPSGALCHDRRFALVDSEGRFINAKRTPRIHQLRLQVDPWKRKFKVAARDQHEETCGHLDKDGRLLSDWLSDFFSLEVSIIENDETGFPDDIDAPGPTMVSTATLQTVADWFEGMNLDEVRRRFRANIEIGGVEPFWEDNLFGIETTPKRFRIGEIEFSGTNPCQRCIVPSRDSLSGEVTPAFSKRFALQRQESLPTWATRERFDHFYRLATNTCKIDPSAGMIRVGDKVELS
jgi:uncharacterized protein YcbX